VADDDDAEDECRPICDHIGTWSEGWYDPCTDERICYQMCDGATVFCLHVGDYSEGWYSEPAVQDCQTGMAGLIQYDDCG